MCGDAMLDADVRGVAFRDVPASPSARVLPAFRLDGPGTHLAAGGAANVALNLAALGADVTLMAGMADDPSGRVLQRLIEGARVVVVRSYAPGTTVKVTYHGPHGVVARVDDDYDAQSVLLPDPADQLPDAVILTDYGRGTLDRDAVLRWGRWAAHNNVPVYVDPKKRRCDMWAGVLGLTAMVLNREEVQDFHPGASETMEDDGSVVEPTLSVLSSCFCSYVVVKRGPYGSSVKSARAGRPTSHVRAVRPGPVVDVQGAGDSYIAALVLGQARGLDPTEAATFASAAAGVAVTKPGTHVVTAREASDALVDFTLPRSHGVLAYADALSLADRLRACGVSIGYTNGCFDLRLTAGHRRVIGAGADRSNGSQFLFVGVDSDDRVRRLKGPDRPIVSESERAAAVAALSGVRATFVFDKPAPEVVAALRPDVLFKGGDYDPAGMPEVPVLHSYGGRFVHTGTDPCPSTTQTVSRIRSSPT